MTAEDHLWLLMPWDEELVYTEKTRKGDTQLVSCEEIRVGVYFAACDLSGGIIQCGEGKCWISV